MRPTRKKTRKPFRLRKPEPEHRESAEKLMAWKAEAYPDEIARLFVEAGEAAEAVLAYTLICSAQIARRIGLGKEQLQWQIGESWDAVEEREKL
jgi:hypothetical protein